MIIKSPESTDEWANYFHLRWQVLRAPWEQPEGSEKDDIEFLNTSFHAMALDINSDVIGVARIHLLDDQVAQIRYMAVSYAWQGKGVGLGLINYLELIAQSKGVKKIILQARENALAFYLKQNYKSKEKTFMMYNQIQHYLMEKEL
jgi:N-acetylglutamate synthase-like GNAT family acetyltransferase